VISNPNLGPWLQILLIFSFFVIGPVGLEAQNPSKQAARSMPKEGRTIICLAATKT
jgi:hypothetical protein